MCYTSNKIYMMWRKALLLLAAALLWMAGALLAQNPPSAKSPQTPPANTEPKTKGDFFAGTVVSLTSTQITVARDVAEGSVEQRSFRITKDTKLSNAVKVRSHVTVHYEHEDGTDVAIEIQIRPVLHPKGAS